MYLHVKITVHPSTTSRTTTGRPGVPQLLAPVPARPRHVLLVGRPRTLRRHVRMLWGGWWRCTPGWTRRLGSIHLPDAHSNLRTNLNASTTTGCTTGRSGTCKYWSSQMAHGSLVRAPLFALLFVHLVPSASSLAPSQSPLPHPSSVPPPTAFKSNRSLTIYHHFYFY